jgi:hypothetical protein
MTNFTELIPVPSDRLVPVADRLRLAVAAYLARFTGSSRWMQEIRHFKPSTVSRRFSVVAGFYRTCVVDDLLAHSPAEHVRRPAVPAESPTLGFTHLGPVSWPACATL